MNYYVDAENGSDDNDGLSIKTPVKTINALALKYPYLGKHSAIRIFPSKSPVDTGFTGSFSSGFKPVAPPEDFQNLDSTYMYDCKKGQWFKA